MLHPDSGLGLYSKGISFIRKPALCLCLYLGGLSSPRVHHGEMEWLASAPASTPIFFLFFFVFYKGVLV